VTSVADRLNRRSRGLEHEASPHDRPDRDRQPEPVGATYRYAAHGPAITITAATGWRERWTRCQRGWFELALADPIAHRPKSGGIRSLQPSATSSRRTPGATNANTESAPRRGRT